MHIGQRETHREDARGAKKDTNANMRGEYKQIVTRTACKTQFSRCVVLAALSQLTLQRLTKATAHASGDNTTPIGTSFAIAVAVAAAAVVILVTVTRIMRWGFGAEAIPKGRERSRGISPSHHRCTSISLHP